MKEIREGKTEALSSYRRMIIAGFCIVAIAQTGCLFNSSYSRVSRKSEPIRSVNFESDYSRQVFNHQALDQSARKSEKSSFTLGIPFIVGLEYESVPSSNAFYNDWVTRVDSNQDGVISDFEVSTLDQGGYEQIVESTPAEEQSDVRVVPVRHLGEDESIGSRRPIVER